ncbi:MAG: M14 family zinc carboxypeptidase [Urechidicola sp.]|nr:M14 family zinc carboxypeptidase [Urechidicola sp.]
MKKHLVVFISLFLSTTILAQEVEENFETIFEQTKGDSTATYEQTIEFYIKLAKSYPEIKIQKVGMTDADIPLHLVLFDADKNFNPLETRKNTILINNGIHPSEPDGVDASMLFLRDLVQSETLKKEYEQIIIAIIPMYNIGGGLNRNSTSRVNQNGPFEYGVRGNTHNFDLNRDFIKSDTKNAQAFTTIFHMVNPDVFIDNHVSNGADYQYTLTHLFTQHNKMGGELGEFIEESMIQNITRNLKNKDLIITPYVNVYNQVPEKGFTQFFDSPRYSTGYTTLFNSLGFMVETHMLKTYKDRVEQNYELLFSSLDFLKLYGYEVKQLRQKAIEQILTKETYPINWEIDSTRFSTLNFYGYEGSYIKSEVTGLKRLKYDQTKPFTKSVSYYNNYKPSKEVSIPNFYVVPKRLKKVVQLLRQNRIQILPLKEDAEIQVEGYTIDRYETVKSPFENHYLHYNTKVTSTVTMQQFKKGDFLVPTNQSGLKYLLETLEPEATDSFFNWNFFDIILQRKEYFSPYVFEDIAKEILDNDPVLKTEFDLKKEYDSDFANNSNAQLDFIYQHSKYAEKNYMRYPIYRILK